MITNHKNNLKMKKTTLLLATMQLSGFAFAQTGINTLTPKASLDVVAKNTDGSTPEGIIPPRLTGNQIASADMVYGTDQIGAMVYATAAASPATTKTANITSEGHYYFSGSVWKPMSGNIATLTTITTPYTILNTDEIILANFAAAGSVTLPANPQIGKKYTIIRTGSQTVTVNGGGNNINNSPTYGGMIRRYQFVSVLFDGTIWIIVNVGG